MSTNKTQVDYRMVQSFVRKRLHIPALALEPIADGETAQAYYFETPEGLRVLRVSSRDKQGFLKDRFAYEHFGSKSIPIPQILDVGEIQKGLYFAVSERMAGKTLDKFSTSAINDLMPAIMATLDAIHAIPPVGEGYGWLNLEGNGQLGSWREQLEKDLLGDDEKTMSVAFYNSSLSDNLRKEIRAMLDFMPEERKLVHRDYGFNNALSDGTDITGVIDWEHAGYGDFLFDVSWLDFWAEKQGYAAAFKKHYAEQGQDVPRFDERLLCYKLLIGLGSLGFFASSRQADKYKHCQGIISRINR